MSDKIPTMSFERLKRIMRENVDYLPSMRDFPRMLIGAVKAYLDDGTVMRVRSRVPSDTDSVQGKLRAELLTLIDSVGLDGMKVLLDLFPEGTDRRIPKWVYGPTEAYFDDERFEWFIMPYKAA